MANGLKASVTANPSQVDHTTGNRTNTSPRKMAYGAQFFSYVGIVDSQGRPRIGMGCDKRDVPFIAMWDAEGKIRLKLQLGVMGLSAEECGEPGITMYDMNGKGRAHAGVNNWGAPCLWFEDEKGYSVWSSPPLERLTEEKPQRKKRK